MWQLTFNLDDQRQFAAFLSQTFIAGDFQIFYELAVIDTVLTMFIMHAKLTNSLTMPRCLAVLVVDLTLL